VVEQLEDAAIKDNDDYPSADEYSEVEEVILHT